MAATDKDRQPPSSPADSVPATEGLPSPSHISAKDDGAATDGGGGARSADISAADYEAALGSEEPIRVLIRVRPPSTTRRTSWPPSTQTLWPPGPRCTQRQPFAPVAGLRERTGGG